MNQLNLSSTHHVRTQKAKDISLSITRWRNAWKEVVLSRLHWKDERGPLSITRKVNCFRGKVGETSERRGGALKDLSERIDTLLNWTELLLKLTSVSNCRQAWCSFHPYYVKPFFEMVVWGFLRTLRFLSSLLGACSFTSSFFIFI